MCGSKPTHIQTRAKSSIPQATQTVDSQSEDEDTEHGAKISFSAFSSEDADKTTSLYGAFKDGESEEELETLNLSGRIPSLLHMICNSDQKVT